MQPPSFCNDVEHHRAIAPGRAGRAPAIPPRRVHGHPVWSRPGRAGDLHLGTGGTPGPRGERDSPRGLRGLEQTEPRLGHPPGFRSGTQSPDRRAAGAWPGGSGDGHGESTRRGLRKLGRGASFAARCTPPSPPAARPAFGRDPPGIIRPAADRRGDGGRRFPRRSIAAASPRPREKARGKSAPAGRTPVAAAQHRVRGQVDARLSIGLAWRNAYGANLYESSIPDRCRVMTRPCR